MKKNKLLVLGIALLTSTSLLASCNDNQHGGNNGGNNGGNVETLTYKINIINVPGITITSNKTEAKKGELVTLNIKLEQDYSLDKLMMNGEALTVNNNVATFKMPGATATINAKLSIKGDVTLQGDIAAKFELKNGIYVIENLYVEKDSDIYVKHGETIYDITHVDRTKTFAGIDFVAGGDGFQINGGSKYNFYFDINNRDGLRPIYIQRTEVVSLPDSSDALEDILYGNVQSNNAMYPSGVTSVKYKRTGSGNKFEGFSTTASFEEYEWNLYGNNKSLAIVHTDQNDDSMVSHVYKELAEDNKSLTVVDDFIEATSDPTKTDDTVAFSGKYEVEDLGSEEQLSSRKYKRTLSDAKFDVVNYSHDTRSLEFDIMNGYRVGFDSSWEETLEDYESENIISTKNSDGTFNVVVDNFKTYEDPSNDKNNEHITYKMDIKFDERGAILEGKYEERFYDSTKYDFSKNEYLPDQIGKGTLHKKLEFSYGYEDALTPNELEFDITPYFLTGFETLNIRHAEKRADNTPIESSTWQQYQAIDIHNQYTVAKPLPSTALDYWQYDITGSSDNSLTKDSYGNWVANKLGKAKATITNHTKYSETIEHEIDIIQDKELLGFGFEGMDGNEVINNQSTVYQGGKYRFRITTTQPYAPKEFIPECSDKSIKVSASEDYNYLNVDLSNMGKIDNAKVVTIKMNSDNYDEDRVKDEPSTLTLTVLPNKFDVSKMTKGSYENEAADGSKVSLSFTDMPVDNNDLNKGKIANLKYVDKTNSANNLDLEIAYIFNEDTYKFTKFAPLSTGLYDSYTAAIMIDFEVEDTLGIYLGKSSYNSSGDGDFTESYTDILGTSIFDTEGNLTGYEPVYVTFTSK